MFLLIIFIIKTTFIRTLLANYMCSVESPRRTLKYHLVEKCYRSKLSIAAYANYTSLASCQRLAIEKNGLAINFSPLEVRLRPSLWRGYGCEVLKCAEADGGLSLFNDTKYDYYSLYARPVPDLYSTCIPAIGMFHLLSTNLNYSEAQRECRNRSAIPADVTTEQRTDALAQLLVGASVSAAFVGLRRENGRHFVKTNGDTLDCTTYRAWAPGHPRRDTTKLDCVVLTRHRTWVSTSCGKRYPTLCELNPGGPYRGRTIFASRTHKGNNSKGDGRTSSNLDIAGLNWRKVARDGLQCKVLEEAFAKRHTELGDNL